MKKTFAIIIMLVLVTTFVFAFTTTGPNFPTAATGNTNTIGGGTVTWTTPTNIETADGVFTTCTGTAATSDDLVGTGFGFAIASTDTINGILLEVNYKASAAATVSENTVNLLKAGVAAGTNKASLQLPTTATTISYGGASDLWGTTWTPSDINNANFGAATTYSWGGTRTTSVDFFRITITSTPGGGSSQMLKMFARTQTKTLKAVR